VPDHAVELPNGDYHVRTKEGGDKTLSGANSSADITYSSPNSLSDEKAIQIREEKRRKEIELKQAKATKAELYQRVEKLEKAIRNDEYQDRDQLMEDLDRFSSFLSTFTVELDEKNGNGDASALDDGEQEAAA